MELLKLDATGAPNAMTSSIYIGISGWRYAPWRGTFYPQKMAQRCELAFASRMLSTIEINGSFYGLQRPESYSNWYEQTPAAFIFSVKAPRYITHIRRLRDMETPIANFFASGVLNLRKKLGPILWQFPPSFRFDAALFERFLKLLPHDTEQASKIARHHDPRMRGRVQLAIDHKRKLRHAVEIRNESFVDPAFIALLRRYRVALVVADTAGKWPNYEDLTADFVYMRLHGAEELYSSGYTIGSLERWAERMRVWRDGEQPRDARLISAVNPRKYASRDIFCYFDNDVKVHAPFDAATLEHMLGLRNDLLGASTEERASFARKICGEPRRLLDKLHQFDQERRRGSIETS